MTFTLDELHALRELLRAAARLEIMPRFRALGSDAIRTKSGPLDLVTDADEQAELMIAAGLHARYPGCTVIGEEAATRDPQLLAQVGGPGLTFVVDPVDGTSNFAAGLPLFGCMAAALVDGVVVGACILDPVMDDAAMALAGQGAWVVAPDRGERRLQVSPARDLAAMTGTLSWRYVPEPRRSRVMQAALQVAGAWDFRCAAHQYRLLADGQLDFSVYNRLMPWDHAPGWLLHKEAGGYSRRFDGGPYSPVQASGGLICAPDAAGWQSLHTAIGGP